MTLTAVSASAAWRITDYDTSSFSASNPTIPIIYEEYDDAGYFTGRRVRGAEAENFDLKGFAEPSLKNTWVDTAWPNLEYINLYADGLYTGDHFLTGRTGEQAGVQYRDVNFMWEAAAPHRVYNKTQAWLNINGTPAWYTDATYPVNYAGENAQVVAQKIPYGFADYKVVGADAIELLPVHINAAFGAPAAGNYISDTAYWGIIGITAAQLAPQVGPAVPVEVPTQANIFIPKTYDIRLTGPAYDADGKEIPNGKVIIGTDITTVRPENLGLVDVVDIATERVTGAVIGCEITWSSADFEAARTPGAYIPDAVWGTRRDIWANQSYKGYDFLTVDGVVMDGRYITTINGVDYYRPYIFRYNDTYDQPMAQ